MKSLKNSAKKIKSAKKKSKSSERALISSVNQVLLNKENLNLEESTQKETKDGSWIQEQTEKNEKELQAVKDLCALSDEDNGSLCFENDFEKMWMDSNKAPNKSSVGSAKGNKLYNPSLTARGEESSGNRSNKMKGNTRMVSRLEVANILQSRNFLRENMFFRTKRDWSKDKKLLGQEQLDKLLRDRDAEISNSLRDLKESTGERCGKGENREINNRRIAEKYVLKHTGTKRETSREENSIWQDSFKEAYQNETSGLFPRGVKVKSLGTIHSARPRSSSQAGDLGQSHSNRMLKQEILALIQKFERSNKRAPLEAKILKVKKRSDTYAEDMSLQGVQSMNNETEINKEVEPHVKAAEAYNPYNSKRIQRRESVTSIGKSMTELESQGVESQPDFNECFEKLNFGFNENQIRVYPNTFYKISKDRGQYVNKPPLSFRQQKRDRVDEKVLVLRKENSVVKDNYHAKRADRYSITAKDISSLPQSIIDDQIDSSKELQPQRYQGPENYTLSSLNTWNNQRPETANLESPERRKIVKALNYFRNSGQLKTHEVSMDPPANKFMRTMYQIRNRNRKEVRSMPRLDKSEISANVKEPLGIALKESNNLSSQYKRLPKKRNSLISMKIEASSTMKNFREIAISTLQKTIGKTFLEAKGKKLN